MASLNIENLLFLAFRLNFLGKEPIGEPDFVVTLV